MTNIISAHILAPDQLPKIFRAKIYQVDNEAPEISVLCNTLELEIAFRRDGQGQYTGVFNKDLDLIQTTIAFATNLGDDTSGIVTIQNFSGAEIQFRTFALYNGLVPQLRDNMLGGTLLEIIEYV